MRKSFIFFLFLSLLLIAFSFVSAKIEADTDKDGLSDYEEQNIYKTKTDNTDSDGDGYLDGEEVNHGYSPTKGQQTKLSRVVLAVPYTTEAPDGNWTGPWKNACEEASIAMVEYYYLGSRTVGKQTAKNFMWNLSALQDKLYGSNANSDAVRTTYLINNYTSFYGKVIDNPTLDDIKKELQQKRPVISLHYGFDLKNKNIPFLANGSSYHMMAIIGYDDDKKEFITNDPGDIPTGNNHRYDYDLFLKTIHDFDFATGKANGTARVIFTYPRLVQEVESGKIYFIDMDKNSKHHVTAPAVFKTKGWSWDMVMLVRKEYLDGFTASADLSTASLAVNVDSKKYVFSKYIRLGDSGQEVKQLQLKLQQLGFFPATIAAEGNFGPMTKKAVIAFQKANGLAPYPGHVGPSTLKALNR